MRPKAVLISDVHFDLSILPLASKVTQMAIDKANDLAVPLCVLGDLHNSKANLRGECMNEMLRLFSQPMKHRPFILIGNHDMLNEKGRGHSLGFLSPYAKIIDEVHYEETLAATFIPYSRRPYEPASLCNRSWGSTLCLVHQGLLGGVAGEYFNDRSALQQQALAGLRIISGHYHAQQTTILPNGGQHDFLGNPYSLSFGEAADPEKGFHVLMEDNSLVFQPTGLRRHSIITIHRSVLNSFNFTYNGLDILWIKIAGPRSELESLNRKKVAEALSLPPTGWKLDLIPTDAVQLTTPTPQVSKEELLDKVIDSVQNTTEAQKSRLKALWKDLAQKD